MTTLPQTTPMRLPRPTPTHLAIPNANGHPVHIPSAPAAPGLTIQDVVRIIRANLWLIVLFAVVSAVGGFFLNKWLAAKYPRYISTGWIEVHTPNELPMIDADSHVVMNSASPQAVEIEQTKQATLMRARYFLSGLLQDSDVQQTTWFKSWDGRMDDAKADLERNLEIVPRSNSNLISIGMSTHVPRDAMVIVKELIKRHVQERTDLLHEMEQKQSETLGSLIQGYKDTIQLLENQMHTQANQLALHLSTSSDGAAGGLDAELLQAIAQQYRSNGEFAEAKSVYESFDKELKSKITPIELQEEMARSGANIGQGLVENLIEALSAMETVYGPESPHVKRLQQQLDDARQHADASQESRKDDIISGMEANYARKMLVAKAQYDEATAELEKVKKELVVKNAGKSEYHKLELDWTNSREMLQKAQAQQRSVQLALDSNNWSTAVPYGEPDMPESPSFPKLYITMAASLMVGLMLSLGIAFLREFTDNSVRSPRDIQKIGQLNLLGMIPHEADDPEAAQARLPLAIFEAPNSIIAEQFRQVRTRLQHSASLDTVRSLLVTGTAPGDGKTMVACNLAAGLALNGRRILLVDANFRRPQIHAVLNIPNDVGFGDVLNSLDLFESAVRPTEVPNLSVLPCGVKATNSTELLESQLLIDFIERALEEYDHVIFDSGPLLLVSETAALAPRVDGVVTVVRARGNSRGMLQRLRDQLRQLKAENLGVILNAVRSTSGGYYAPMIKSYYAYHQNG